MLNNDLMSKLIPALLFLILGLIESFGGLYFQEKRTKNDWGIELISLLILPTLIQPGVFVFIIWIGNLWFSSYQNHYILLPIAWQIFAFIIFDDFTQYWWHRLSHTNSFLWKLHRTHHVVEKMGVLVTFRNAFLYYAFMPGIWFSAILIFLGMNTVFYFYLPTKLIVILLAHSDTKWDRFLYKYQFLKPFAWLIERTISTPSTHFAHHGLTEKDGISNPNGNFGNLLFLWDVIFGSAKITRQYPSVFGVQNKIKEPWYIQLFFPFFKSNQPESELNSFSKK
jgi:sterol desaturase/sphingolipid hydroxylase (fatty acid hydroxylase superfamily)